MSRKGQDSTFVHFCCTGNFDDTEFKGEHLYIDIISNKHRTKEKVIQRKNKTMTKYNDIL